jgi:hypothetical protein
MSNDIKFLYNQYSKWADVCRYTIPELLFVPEFYTGCYQYILYPLYFFHFLTIYHFFPLLRSVPELLKFHFEHCIQHYFSCKCCFFTLLNFSSSILDFSVILDVHICCVS